jgi:hypothetical protein
MLPFTQMLFYGLARQSDLIQEAARERARLGHGGQRSSVRAVVNQAAEWLWQALQREAELCTKLEPACEMQYA